MAAQEQLMSDLFGDSGSSDEEPPAAAHDNEPHPFSAAAATKLPKREAEGAPAGTGADSDSDESDDGFGDALDQVGADAEAEAEEDRKMQVEEVPEEKLELSLRRVVPPCPPGAREVKVPKTLLLDPTEWNIDSFSYTESQKVLLDEYDESVLMPVGNVVRWRWSDEEGNRVKESNARIVRWSDGTTQLMVGNDCVVDMQSHPIAEHKLVFAKLGEGVIECQTRLGERVTLRPNKKTISDFSKRVAAIKAARSYSTKIKHTTIKANTNTTQDKQLKSKQKQKQMKSSAAAERQREEMGMTENFLESSDDSDADEVDEDRLRRVNDNATANTKVAGSEDSSEDVGLSDDDDAQAGGEGARTAASPAPKQPSPTGELPAMPKKKRARLASSDEDDD